jgi:hypothetical protein
MSAAQSTVERLSILSRFVVSEATTAVLMIAYASTASVILRTSSPIVVSSMLASGWLAASPLKVL